MNLKHIMILGFIGIGILLTLGVSLVSINQRQNTQAPAWQGCTCINGEYVGDYCPPYTKNQTCENEN